MRAEGSNAVAYLAVGDAQFLGEALASSASVRKHTKNIPIILFTDQPNEDLRTAFDLVVHVKKDFSDARVGQPPWKSPNWLTRIEAFEKSPFANTLLLDADTEIVSDISGIFELLDRFDIAAAHAPYRYHTRQTGIPDSFPEFNCGVVALRKSRASKNFLQKWRVAYLRDAEYWHHDQVAFRAAAWASTARIATLPPEFNLRPLRLSAKSKPLILHGFSRSSAEHLPSRKLRHLTTDHGCTHHRSGWEFVTRCLSSLTHPNGVLFDSLVENTYGWHTPRYNGYLPKREPWVGIVHNPPNIPEGYFNHVRPQVYSRSSRFLEGLSSCRGLFALSKYQADWFSRLGTPIEVLYHPTDLEVPRFSWKKFCSYSRRRLLHIGWWLRRLESFSKLKTPSFSKTLISLPTKNAMNQIKDMSWESVEISPYQTAAAYDRLLQSSIVFVDLIDSSANNVILDCIARATPITTPSVP